MLGCTMDATDPARLAFDQHPLHRTLGITLDEQREGFARIRIATGPVTLGGVAGSVHGGVLAAMVDIVMLAAIAPAFRTGDRLPAGTADLNLTYLRPALGAYVFAEAEVIRMGRQLAMTEISILDGEGRLCAKGRTLYSFRAGAQ